MLTLILLLAMIWITFKLMIFGIKAAWGIAKLVCTLVFLPFVIIGLCLMGFVYVALAVLIFVILWLCGIINWLVFIYAIPVSLITLLVLNSVWGDRSWNLYIVSGLVWGIICSIYLSFLQYNWWQLFLLGIPAQIIIIFAFSIRRKPKKQ